MHSTGNTESTLNPMAEEYVRLVLAVGHHDTDYVDAYYGPAAWKDEVEKEHLSLEQIAKRAASLLQALERANILPADPVHRLRHDYLMRQTASLSGRVKMLLGTPMNFDEEARTLYDVTPPSFPEEHFDQLLSRIGALLPGDGEVAERYLRFIKDFIIPRDRLDAVFAAAITEGRARTMAYLTLPDGEQFSVEYVTGKPWSGYNWYKGDGKSLIQVNVDFPITIDRAVDLACHEGYPGHHVYNSLLEYHLVHGRGWKEFSVYALFSPQSMIAEGTANFGIEMALPGEKRIAFERTTLFPLAGLDAERAVEYYRVQAMVQQLAFAGNEAARSYLNGTVTREEAARWLTRYALMSPDRAMQRTRFFDAYRSYVINYNVGQDIVRRYVEDQGGTTDNPRRRWEIFSSLLTSPRVPSGLQ